MLNRHTSFRRSAAAIAEGITVRPAALWLRFAVLWLRCAALRCAASLGCGLLHAHSAPGKWRVAVHAAAGRPGRAARPQLSLLCSVRALQSLTTNSSTDWSQASSQQRALDAAEQGLPGPEALEQLRSMSLEQAVQFYNKRVLWGCLWMGCDVGGGAAVALPPRAAEPACDRGGTAGARPLVTYPHPVPPRPLPSIIAVWCPRCGTCCTASTRGPNRSGRGSSWRRCFRWRLKRG